jgi:uncharacterized protein YbjT (DUF2867 family)
VLLTGATGFIGKRVYPALLKAGWDVTSATRHVEEQRAESRRWVRFDVQDQESVVAALEGQDAVLYLIHAMGQGGDFEEKERAAAETLRRSAERAGVRRIVYVGGVAPAGEASKHLRSRLQTGEVLRSGTVATIELRAGMIIGAGGLSWNMVRDLAARLPFMILPSWLQNRSQPVAIDDVVAALLRALELGPEVSGAFDLPGPETLTGEQILRRIASLIGVRPYTVRVPVLTPRLSSYWLKLVTRADLGIAQELVEGLTSDLLAGGEQFWVHMQDRSATPFDVAARAALAEDDSELAASTRALEWLLHHVTRSA